MTGPIPLGLELSSTPARRCDLMQVSQPLKASDASPGKCGLGTSLAYLMEYYSAIRK